MLNSHFLHFLKRSERISTGKSRFLKDLNLQLSAICYFFQLKFQSSQRIQAKEPSENNRGFNPRHLWFILMMIMQKQETKQINFYKCQCCNHCAASWKSLFFTFEQRKFTLGSISHKMNEKKMEDWCQPHVDHFQIPASVSHSFVFDPHTSSKVFVYIKVIPADSIIQQDKMFERKQVVKETVGGVCYRFVSSHKAENYLKYWRKRHTWDKAQAAKSTGALNNNLQQQILLNCLTFAWFQSRRKSNSAAGRL